MDISRIVDKCWENRITVAELERNAGLSNGAISKWKNVSPRLESIQRIASYFGCGVDDLIVSNEIANRNPCKEKSVTSG